MAISIKSSKCCFRNYSQNQTKQWEWENTSDDRLLVNGKEVGGVPVPSGGKIDSVSFLFMIRNKKYVGYLYCQF